MSKKTQHVIIAAAIGCYFLFLVGMIWYFNRDAGETSTETDATATEAELSASDSDAVPAAVTDDAEKSEKLAGMLADGLSVLYEGTELTFPCDYTDILSEEDGWEVHGNGLYDSAVSFGKEDLNYEVLLYMPTEETGTLETLEETECSGIGISFTTGSGLPEENLPQLAVSWITWGDSIEDVKSAFGEPCYVNVLTEDDGSTAFTYLFYWADYEGKTYRLEIVTGSEDEVLSISFYYIPTEE